ncbi:hypothetical protein INT44_003104 [Umbelopsis vinacea]|uniref:Rho-GAP domain-containing protein n=1 Tax=Umbelopsis vinacea TaxID=44442 RepID=A0A8H7UM74_9FUNG|nr:hypothetical protein INT44_003104 [Umbelopsis vinacea]
MTTESLPISASELKHQYQDAHSNLAAKKPRKSHRDSSRNSAVPLKAKQSSPEAQKQASPPPYSDRIRPPPNRNTKKPDAPLRNDQRKQVNSSTNDLRVRAPTSEAASHIERFNIAMMPYNVSRIVSEVDDNSSLTPHKVITPKSSKSSITATSRTSPLAFKKGRSQNSKSFDATPQPINYADMDVTDNKPKRSSNLFAMLLSKRTPSADKMRSPKPSAAFFGVALEDNYAFTSVDVKGEKIVVPTILNQCWMEVRKRGLEVEGIFRINGGEKEVTALCEEFEKAPVEVHDFSAMNIHTLPSVIKKYLGALPEPVIPVQFSSVFMEVVDLNTSEFTKIEALIELGSLMAFPHLHLLVYLLDVIINDILEHSEKNLITSEALAVLLYPSCSGQEILSVAAAAARRPGNRRNFHGVFQGSKNEDTDSMLNAATRNSARCMQMWEFLMDNREPLTNGWRKNIRKVLTSQKRSTKEIISFVAGDRYASQNEMQKEQPSVDAEDRKSISATATDGGPESQNTTDHHSISDTNPSISSKHHPSSSDASEKTIDNIYPDNKPSKQDEHKQLRLKASLSTPTSSSSPEESTSAQKKGFFARLRTTSMTTRNGPPPVPAHQPPPPPVPNHHADVQRNRPPRQHVKQPSFRARAAAEKVIKRRSVDLANKRPPEPERTSVPNNWVKKTYKVAFKGQPNE